MITASTSYEVHQFFKILGDTWYYCVSCICDLCPQCKENHVKYLKTIDHDVWSYSNKINYIPAQTIYMRHPNHVYIKCCEPCQLSMRIRNWSLDFLLFKIVCKNDKQLLSFQMCYNIILKLLCVTIVIIK